MAVLRQGFAKLTRRRRGIGGEGLRQVQGCGRPPTPPLFIGGERVGWPPLDPIYGWGGSQGGRSASQVKWRPSPLGFPLSHAHGPWGGWCPWPIKARAPPYSPCCCIGRGGMISGPPNPSGILRKLLEASRYNTEKTQTFFRTRTTTFHI